MSRRVALTTLGCRLNQVATQQIQAGLEAPSASPHVSVGDLRSARLSAMDPRPRTSGRSCALVKVQDGCQHRCAFGIVPLARGASRSLEELPFTYLHVFPYSARKGTEAAARAERVAPATVVRRAAAMRALGEAKAAAFRRSLAGRLEEVLVLESRERASGGLVGLTGHYAEIVFHGPDALKRRLTRVRITEAGGAGLRGQLEEERAA